MDAQLEGYLDQLPFLTYGRAHGQDYIGIMVVSSKNYTSMYVLNNVDNPTLRKKLIELGEKWWWQSNRNIPINLFMPEQMEAFEFCRQRFMSKDIDILKGPIVSLMKLPTKRIKRCTTILKVAQ